MRSKVAVIVSLLIVLAIGGAALAVNTRILDTSPQPDIGRANEVLAPRGEGPPTAPTTVTPSVLQTVPTQAPPPTASPHDDHDDDDEHEADERSGRDEDDHEPDD